MPCCRLCLGHVSCLNRVLLRSRQRFKDLIRKHDVPWELICNYDQTWVNPWRSPRTMLKRKRTKRPSRNQTRMTSIVGARAGVSICTSSFCNGDRGPLFISVASNCLGNKWIAEMNECFYCIFEFVFCCIHRWRNYLIKYYRLLICCTALDFYCTILQV